MFEDDPFRDAPYTLAVAPPVTFPLITRRPVDVEAFVEPDPLVPDETFPVIFNVPEAVFPAPTEFVPVPPVTFPIIKREPEFRLYTAIAFCAEPPVQLPTMVADAGEALEKVIVFVKAALPPSTVAERETPSIKTTVPLAEIPVAEAFLKVDTLVFVFAVTVKVFV